MTTKNPFRYTWFWALLAVALAVPAAHATQVNNITLGRFEDFAVVTLYGDNALTVTHQMVEAKDGKPNRIVVDVAGATHGLPDNNFRELPKSSITAIRTSQFAVSPVPVVRIVLDLAQPAAYQLKSTGSRVRIMVSLPQDPPITLEWSARDLTTGNAYASTEPGSKPAVQAVAEPRPATPAENAAPAARPSTQPAEPKVVAKPAAEKPAADMPLPKPAPKPAPIPLPASDARPAFAQDHSDVPDQRFDEVVPVPMPKAQGEQDIHYDIPAPRPVHLTQTPEPKAEPAPKPVKTAQAEPVKKDSPKPAANTPEATVASAPPKPEAAKSAPATPIPDPGSKPVASLTTLPPPVVIPDEIVPEREKIVYHTMGRRDPFSPLIKVGAAYNAAALPDVNGLRMVGVLHDVQSSWGLFEDANGYGYILKQGDRVRNGRLAKLTKNKAFFQLTEFGWSRSVQLDLEREG